MARCKNVARNPNQCGLKRATFAKGEDTQGVRKRCRVCGDWVVGRMLKRHLRERHYPDAETRKFKCQECSYMAKRISDLRRHSQAKHPKLNVRVISDEEYVPQPLPTSNQSQQGDRPKYVPTPLEELPAPSFPDVDKITSRASAKPMPCEVVNRLAAATKQSILAALEDPCQRDELKTFLSEQGLALLTKEELREAKCDAKRRGKEEGEKIQESQPAREAIQQDWADTQAQPVAGRWTPIPRQVVINDKLVAFDLRMRLMDIPEGVTTPKVVKKTRKRVPKTTPSSEASNPATQSSDIPSTQANTPPASSSSSTASSPVVKEEVTLIIGPPDEGAKDKPILVD